MKYLVLIITLLFLVRSYAIESPFQGFWKGNASYSAEGEYIECDFVEVDLEFEDSQLHVNKIEWECGEKKFNLPLTTLEIEDGKLYYMDKELGSITDSQIKIAYEAATYELRFNFTLINGAFFFFQTVIPKEGKEWGLNGILAQ